MSFIQCKNETEVEKTLQNLKHGFVTEDHRIYNEIQMSDDAAYWELSASTLMTLFDLQTSLEMFSDNGHEMSFLEVEKDAKTLRETFEKTLEAVKFKPLKRKEK